MKTTAAGKLTNRKPIPKEIYQPLSRLPEELVLNTERAERVFIEIAKIIKDDYGFEVCFSSKLGSLKVKDKNTRQIRRFPRTGTFNGLEIKISPDLVPSERLFTMLHLFGHSVQCCSPSESEIVNEFYNTPDDSGKKLEVLRKYEFRAAEFGMYLLNKVDPYLSGWFTDFVHTDHNMVAQTICTGQLPQITHCFVRDGKHIVPHKIPDDLRPHNVNRTSVAY